MGYWAAMTMCRDALDGRGREGRRASVSRVWLGWPSTSIYSDECLDVDEDVKSP